MTRDVAASMWWTLLWSDYLAHYGYKHEGRGRAVLLFAPRMLTNSSMHASLLIRLALTGPRPLRSLSGAVLLSTHGCSLSSDCEIGPGLQITHPIGLSIGPAVKLGRDAALFHGITLAGDGGEEPGQLVIGDGVEIFTGSVVKGALVIGDRCVVGANAVLTHDLPDDTVYTRRREASFRA